MAYFNEAGPVEADFISGNSLFTDQPGHEWLSSWIFNWSLVLAVSGEGEVVFDAGKVPLSRGELILIEPNLPHRFRVCSSWGIVWIHFLMRPHMARELHWSETLPGVRHAALAGTEFRRARAALLEAHQRNLHRSGNWQLLAYTLTENVLCRGMEAAQRAREGNENSPILKAQDLLLDFANRNSIDRIAELCGLSRAEFYARFKKLVGVAPREYRELHAMRHAQQLLRMTALPIAEIARQCGMENAFYFSARFRKFCGCSPSDYRHQS